MTVDVLIPTFKNAYWIRRCLASLAEAKMPELGKVIIIDNGGDFYESNHVTPGLDVMVLNPGKNLGWTGGLAEGLKRSQAPLVLFMNDDAEFERRSDRLALLSSHFIDPDVAAVGPATGVCMGRQAVEGPDLEPTKMLVGFCVLLRRKHLDEVGGVRLEWPLGDDVDLSIRFTKAGKKMLIDRRVFVYHHAFKTGVKVYGAPRKDGGWNSLQMVSGVTQKLILAHGATAVIEAMGDDASPSPVQEIVLDAD